MKYFFCVVLTFLLFSCAPKELPQQESVVDLESLGATQPDVDMALFDDPPEKNSKSPQQQNPSNEKREAPPTVVLNAQTLPISEPHASSPGGVIADTLRIFQCENLNAQGQDNFFLLHVLNYRIHKLGAHPLCEVIQVTDLQKEEITKEILTHAHYQRDYCDTYTSEFINELKQHQCVQVITLMPSDKLIPSDNEPQV